jgi:hypothetical protein
MAEAQADSTAVAHLAVVHTTEALEHRAAAPMEAHVLVPGLPAAAEPNRAAAWAQDGVCRQRLGQRAPVPPTFVPPSTTASGIPLAVQAPREPPPVRQIPPSSLIVRVSMVALSAASPPSESVAVFEVAGAADGAVVGEAAAAGVASDSGGVGAGLIGDRPGASLGTPGGTAHTGTALMGMATGTATTTTRIRRTARVQPTVLRRIDRKCCLNMTRKTTLRRRT